MADDTRLTAQELTAWAQGAGEILTGWEFDTLLELSAAYVTQRYAARKLSCPAPWVPAPSKIDRAKVAASVRNFLRE